MFFKKNLWIGLIVVHFIVIGAVAAKGVNNETGWITYVAICALAISIYLLGIIHVLCQQIRSKLSNLFLCPNCSQLLQVRLPWRRQ